MDDQFIAAEVESLHRFIEQWFNGTVQKTTESFSRLSNSWPEGFTLIDPNNKSHSSSVLLKSTYDHFGKFPCLSIQVRNIRTSRHLPGVAVAVYEEWHVDTHETEARLCSATFTFEAADPSRPQWVHIHESKLATGANAL